MNNIQIPVFFPRKWRPALFRHIDIKEIDSIEILWK